MAKWLRLVAVIFFLFSTTTFGNFYPAANAREHTVYTLEESRSFTKENVNYTSLKPSANTIGDTLWDTLRLQNGTQTGGVCYNPAPNKQFRITEIDISSSSASARAANIQFRVGYGDTCVSSSGSSPTVLRTFAVYNVMQNASGSALRTPIQTNFVVPAGKYPAILAIASNAVASTWVIKGFEESAGVNVTSTEGSRNSQVVTWSLESNTYTVNQTMELAWTSINSTLSIYSLGTLLYSFLRKLE